MTSLASRAIFWRLLTLLLVVAVGLVLYQWWFAVSPQRTYIETIERPEKKQLRFFVLGDTGTGDDNQHAVAKAMDRECLNGEVDGILLLGDNFYQNGVESVSDPQWDEKLFRPYNLPCLRSVPIFAVLGNHDYRGNVQAQIQMTNMRERWHLPHRYYRIEYGQFLQVVAMDTNLMTWCMNPNICSLDFLKQSMDSREDFRWTVVMAHHPIVSASKKYDKRLMLASNFRSWLMKKYICGSADAYLAGHAHHLEWRRDAECPTDLVVSGAGGADLYDVFEDETGQRFADSKYGFAEMQLDAESMKWRFIDISNRVLFERTTSRANP